MPVIKEKQFFQTQVAAPGGAKVKSEGTASAADKLPPLFNPLKIRDITFSNRVFVSPMCMFSCGQDGFATDFHLAHIAQHALHGTGLVMMEATGVVADGRISPACLGIWSDDHIAPLKRIVDLVHALRGRVGIQLSHAGRKGSTYAPFDCGRLSLPHGSTAPADAGGWPDRVVAPSAVPWDASLSSTVPHELTVAEIKGLVEAFKAAAARADAAGFDVIELHAAHGYLLHQFLSPISNKRTDAYGGPTLQGRSRILCEIIAAIRGGAGANAGVWPASKPLFLRLSCSDWIATEPSWDVDESVALCKIVKELGVDIVDCSSGGLHPAQKVSYAPGYQVHFAEKMRKEAGIPTIAVGCITDAKQANEILSKGQADVIMMAREFLRDCFVSKAAFELGNLQLDYINQYRMGAK